MLKPARYGNNIYKDEIDASFLYKVFADLEADTDRKKDIKVNLPEVENRHVTRWQEMLAPIQCKC